MCDSYVVIYFVCLRDKRSIGFKENFSLVQESKNFHSGNETSGTHSYTDWFGNVNLLVITAEEGLDT